MSQNLQQAQQENSVLGSQLQTAEARADSA